MTTLTPEMIQKLEQHQDSVPGVTVEFAPITTVIYRGKHLLGGFTYPDLDGFKSTEEFVEVICQITLAESQEIFGFPCKVKIEGYSPAFII